MNFAIYRAGYASGLSALVCVAASSLNLIPSKLLIYPFMVSVVCFFILFHYIGTRQIGKRR
ncbi:hypothetical protein DXV75_07155 [Alteromonas aestuariivivens]|uniref:Uncharacterized protein n=1 Tax=Alteromonas aestuariivivens TaxID=1938339 RepID=A0A3D8MAP1_9ALTE|nr:hypothetical protein [Alteromonas aestuariivivens]RDV26758.1 hypothetical protein DXV75_07155 [Alteromonas aestuariivivens]